MSHQIGLARFEWLEENQEYIGKPITSDSEDEQKGKAHKFLITTEDKLKMVFAIVEWPDNKPDVIPIKRLSGLEKYDRLEQAGRFSIFTDLPNLLDSWAWEVRVMKFGEDSNRQNLHKTNLEELDRLLETGNARDVLMSFGATRICLRGDVDPNAGNRASQLMVVGESGNKDLVAASFAISRVLAVMKDYGK